MNLMEPLVMETRTWGSHFVQNDFKMFRLHAIRHEVPGAVRAHNSKDPCYCYMIGRGPISCLLGHATGLLFCFYLKHFLSSTSNSFDF